MICVSNLFDYPALSPQSMQFGHIQLANHKLPRRRDYLNKSAGVNLNVVLFDQE